MKSTWYARIAICVLVIASWIFFRNPHATNAPSARETKMKQVVEKASRLVNTPDHASRLRNGNVFFDARNLDDVEIVGVSVVINEAGNQVHVSLTADYFDSKSTDELAVETAKKFRHAIGEQLLLRQLERAKQS